MLRFGLLASLFAIGLITVPPALLDDSPAISSANAQERPEQIEEATEAKLKKAKKPEAKKPEAKTPDEKYLRVRRSKDHRPVGLDTSIVRFQKSKSDDALQVDLIGAVHIGDAKYYEKLNEAFKDYDVVLYELVANDGTAIKRGEKSDNPFAFLQQSFTKTLGLTSQLDKVDYSPENLIHADLSPEGMAEAMAKRGDDALTVSLSVLTEMLRDANRAKQAAEAAEGDDAEDDGAGDGEKPEKWEPAALSLFDLMTNPKAGVELKLTMADNFDQDLESGLGQTLNVILIEDRNKAVMEKLQEQIDAGKKKIGIFYGAAHMPDFEKRLADKYGLKSVKVSWLEAWDMSK